jgi:hypothetical protein
VAQQLDDCDAWSDHWLQRWLKETSSPKRERTADVAIALAELPVEPKAALETIREACRA